MGLRMGGEDAWVSGVAVCSVSESMSLAAPSVEPVSSPCFGRWWSLLSAIVSMSSRRGSRLRREESVL